MTIYRDSKRIVGTNADRVGTPAVTGGWKELGRTTLGSATSTMSVSSLPDKRYYQVLLDMTQTIDSNYKLRLNNDTGSNYAFRFSNAGGSDNTSTSQTSIDLRSRTANEPTFWNGYIANLDSKEKLSTFLGTMQGSAGAGTEPSRTEQVGKWANTSDSINQIGVTSGSGNLASGSEVVVLGYDSDDTHTDNFWEELDDSSWSSGSSWTSGTFTAKKYLWVQFYTEGGAGSSYFRFNGDSGNNYSNRYSINGGSDSTIASQPESYLGAIDGLSFHNLFIINNASNEKLFTHQRVSRSSAGAGTAPTRNEGAGKWSNTSNQITSITVTTAGGGNLTAGNMKVWGSN